MEEKFISNNLIENDSALGPIWEEFYSVEFSLNDKGPNYMFKLRNTSLTGPCILVKKDSSVFKQLKVGDILNMEYNPSELSGPSKSWKTQITSINSNYRFTNHSLVELSIIDKLSSEMIKPN
ncbi:MAG: hypothetical protein JSW04_10215 [Desulfobacterales bacterium]|nr:MAG: hypothetical protein JSW04_10215 [Desulfobacterales bacterium]